MLAICTPIHRFCEADFMGSLHQTMVAAGSECVWLHTIGHANLPRARNYLVAQARAKGAESIVFVDSDIGWEVSAFAALFDAPEDARVVAGIPQRRDSTLRFAGGLDRQGGKRNGKVLSGIAGTSFLRIDTSVFDELESKTESYTHDGISYPAFFQTPIQNGELLDEDVYFSRLCKRNGIEVWIDPAIPLRHWHSVPLTEVMADHIKLQPLKEAANG